MKPSNHYLKKGKKVSNYKILYLVGRGGFGQVYKAEDYHTHQLFALKTERMDITPSYLLNEISTLKELDSPVFPSIRDKGKVDDYKYFVMNMYGYSIHYILKQQNTKKIKGALTIPISLKMLDIIQELHQSGFIHRDIKPSNFLLNQSDVSPIVLVDFGLSTRYISNDTNEHIKLESTPNFYGTKKYASINAHDCVALSRRDDLISWFYSIVELYKKSLPWNTCSTTEEMIEMKRNIEPEDICDGLPPEFLKIHGHIFTLNFTDEPKYEKLRNLLLSIMKNAGNSPEMFNWSKIHNLFMNVEEFIPNDDNTKPSVKSRHSRNNSTKAKTGVEEDEDEQACNVS